MLLVNRYVDIHDKIDVMVGKSKAIGRDVNIDQIKLLRMSISNPTHIPVWR